MPTFVPIPELAAFLSQTLSVGTTCCARTQIVYDNWMTGDQSLANEISEDQSGTPSFYYDFACWAYEVAKYYDSISDSANAAMFRTAALQNLVVWDGDHLQPVSYGAAGWNAFTRGLRKAYEYTGDTQWRTKAQNIRNDALYGGDYVPYSWYLPIAPEYANVAREAAYHVANHIQVAKMAGTTPKVAQYAERREAVFFYLDWWADEGWDGSNYQISPFQMGLMARTAIEDWSVTKDSRTVPYLKRLGDYLIANAYDTVNDAYGYDINPGSAYYDMTGADDLNNLICPMFAWLAWQTGDQAYMTHADELFAKNVTGANWQMGKALNQNEVWIWGELGFFETRNRFYAPASTSRRLIRRRGV